MNLGIIAHWNTGILDQYFTHPSSFHYSNIPSFQSLDFLLQLRKNGLACFLNGEQLLNLVAQLGI